MAITDTITLSMFRDYFYKSDQYNNVFSYKGLEKLYNYLWELSEDIGEDIEMDIVAFSCDYAEYNSIKDFQEDYGKEYKTIKDIEEQTTVIKLKNNFSYEGLEALYNDLKEDNTSFIIQQF